MKIFAKITLPFVFFLLINACSQKIKKNLSQEDKFLLYSYNYKGKKKISTSDFSPYLAQKPNKKILGVPLGLYIYYFGKEFYDPQKIELKKSKVEDKYNSKIAHTNDTFKIKKLITKKEQKLSKLNYSLENGNLIMRKLGSAPVFFDSMGASNSAVQIQKYLFSKGYFNARVSYDTDTLLKYIFVNFNISQGNRYAIENLKWESEDGNINRHIKDEKIYSPLKKDDYYDEKKVLEERERLDKLLKSNGYYDFKKSAIEFELDTFNSKVSMKIVCKLPPDSSNYKIYTVNKVEFEIDKKNDFDIAYDSINYTTISKKGILYTFGNRYYKPKILYSKLLIGINKKYNYELNQFSQRNLSQLDVFKLVNIEYAKDSTGNGLTAKISANSTTKYLISDEIGFSVTQGLPGPFGSVTFLARNVFNGCELFDFNIRGGIEGVASVTDQNKFYQSQELSASIGLTFPRLFLISKFNELFVNNNPRTRFSGSFNLIFRPEYRRTNYRIAGTYFLNKNQFNQYSFSFLDVSYLRTPYLENVFRAYLDTLFIRTGNNLKRSFQSAISSNFNFAYTYNNFVLGENKNATFFRIYLESGGTTLNLLSQKAQDEIKSKAEVASLYVYWKLNFDIRKYIPISPKSTFATRLNIGIANPYAGDKALPYEKYFFSGGSNSIRAWLPRRLGPGSFAVYNNDGTINYNFEQPGLVQLELNEEYRFKIVGFFDGAIFVDAGNVWLIDDQDKRKNISKDFVSQIAIGAGYGFRFDFSFLIVRLDAAYKTYNPARQKNKWEITETNFLSLEDIFYKATWNIAVGYPF